VAPLPFTSIYLFIYLFFISVSFLFSFLLFTFLFVPFALQYLLPGSFCRFLVWITKGSTLHELFQYVTWLGPYWYRRNWFSHEPKFSRPVVTFSSPYWNYCNNKPSSVINLIHYNKLDVQPYKFWSLKLVTIDDLLLQYCHELGMRDYRRGMDWYIGFIDQLYASLGSTLYGSLTHTHTSVLSLLQSPLVVSWQRI
jgi:hypothetical protein